MLVPCSRDTRPMTTASRPSKASRPGLLLLAAFVAVATLLAGAGTASAGTWSSAGNRIGASTPALANIVGAAEHITAGQGQGEALRQAEAVVATGVAANTAAKVCSFAGTTLVLMADGSKKPIDQVKVGALVLATDPETGEQVAKTVGHVFVHEDTVIDLIVDGEVISTTEDHPFWSVTDQRFERADELAAGEEVLSANGRAVTVSGLHLGTVREAVAFNLTVQGIHTYHVGASEILVHNACVIPSASNYRTLFTDAHPNLPSNYQVHHALPQEYAGTMQDVGVNIHAPSMLRGVDPAIHSKITTAWGRWERGLGRTPTADDITRFSYQIDEMYGSSFVW